MNSVNTQAKEVKSKPKKYTTREVFDSLYWSITDCDEEVDGNLHIVSTLNGDGTTLPLKDILDAFGIDITKIQ